MAWEASDIAILVTSAAAFVTAVTGAGIPLWLAHQEKTKARKKALYERISESLFFCIENIEQVVDIERSDAMRHAFLKAGKTATYKTSSDEEVLLNFGKHSRRAELHLAEIDVNSSLFEAQISTIRASRPKYTLTDGNLTEVDGNAELLRTQVKGYGEMVKSAAHILKTARATLNVD